MSQLENRLNKLEQAAAQAQPAIRWSKLWQDLEIAYGSGRRYTAEELIDLDLIDPAPYWKAAMAKVYGGHVMSNLKNRVDRLEAASPDDIAGRLGGLAVVVPLPDGRFQLPDKREVTQGELDTLLHGARGRLLILRIRS